MDRPYTRTHVATADQASRVDAAAISAGIPSRALMRVAGCHAATIIRERYADRLASGVTVYTGSGNNGGDGWVVAGALARAGVTVHVCEVIGAASPDAVAERNEVRDLVAEGEPSGSGVIVDAILGTGSRGLLRDPVVSAVQRINAHRASGAAIVALDLPTGVDATSGIGAEQGVPLHVTPDLTVAFGTCKQGHLLARDACGDVVIVDIGLRAQWTEALPQLVDQAWVAKSIPPIPFDAHKGTRKKLAIVAGGAGMGGAVLLAIHGALRSGIGMTKVITDPSNIESVRTRFPEALTETLPLADEALHALNAWCDVALIGPGLPATPDTRALIERFLKVVEVPVVLDAGALTAFAGDYGALSSAIGRRAAILTPHPLEYARLKGLDVADVLARRFDVGLDVAQSNVTLLLKGAPTIVTGPFFRRFVSAAGSAALGTAGSGDTLGGIVATLLAQIGDAPSAAAAGAWVHGRAAELCRTIRGVTLDDIVAQLPAVWEELRTVAASPYPVLAELKREWNDA